MNTESQSATQTGQHIGAVVGARIRKARREQGMTQDQLAAPRFTKGYISALERGAVRPSLKALEHIASRLGLPISHFLTGVEAEAAAPPGESGRVTALRDTELGALQEDLNYQYNYARMLIRTGRQESIDEALALIQEAEESAARYARRLPARLLYRPNFLRGLAYLQMSRPESARPYLEEALQAATGDEQAAIISHNMLGVAYYLMEQPSNALHHHLQCFYAIERGVVKDLSLHLSIMHNLANDYWAMRDVPQAVSTYKEALRLVEDLNGVERQASLYWALATAYRAANDWPQAKLYATRALHIYETLDDLAGAASVCIHLAELYTRDGRYDEAEAMLAKAGELLGTAGDQVLQSHLHCDYANLYLKQGDVERAAEHAERSLALIRQAAGEPVEEGRKRGGKGAKGTQAAAGARDASTGAATGPATGYPPLNVTTAYAEALRVSALVSEQQGGQREADAQFERALQLVRDSGLTELAHSIAYSYGEMLSARGDYQRAAVQYRLAAEAGGGTFKQRI